METSKRYNQKIVTRLLFHVGIIAVIFIAISLIKTQIFETCSKNDMKYLRQTAEDVYSQISSGSNIIEVPDDITAKQNLTSITVCFSSSSHLGTVTITTKDGLPQYDEDFQEVKQNIVYALLLTIGTLIYICIFYFTNSKKNEVLIYSH